MDLQTMVSIAYNTNWTKINNFTISMAGLEYHQAGKPPVAVNDMMLNAALISCEIPALNIAPIETYIGGKWYYTNGRPDMARVTLTFRDYDSFHLYKSFTSEFEHSLGNYPSNGYMTLAVYEDSDEIAHGNTDRNKILLLENLLIENISQLSFSNNTENQIAEFSVTVRGERQNVISVGKYDTTLVSEDKKTKK